MGVASGNLNTEPAKPDLLPPPTGLCPFPLYSQPPLASSVGSRGPELPLKLFPHAATGRKKMIGTNVSPRCSQRASYISVFVFDASLVPAFAFRSDCPQALALAWLADSLGFHYAHIEGNLFLSVGTSTDIGR
jgi:hypothetical protein